jgi:hypothetical protein
LTGEDVPTDDRRIVTRAQKASWGDLDVYWFKAALVEGYVFGNEAAETVYDGAVGDSLWCVDVGVDLWSGTFIYVK